MDEPTAALNDAEVEVLHGLIRRFVQPDTGVIYISHRMDELKRIADRITVIRDGHYVGTREAAQTSMDEVISMMVGREIARDAQPAGVAGGPRRAARGRRVSARRTLLKDVSFELREGEILGFAGLMGAGRTEVARALVGADQATAGRSRCAAARSPSTTRPTPPGTGSATCPRTASSSGCCSSRSVNANIVLSALRERFQPLGFVKRPGDAQDVRGVRRTLRIKTPSVAQTVKNLSGGNQQKVVLAKWLVKDCDILIFDEPTRGIDVGAKEEIYRLLNELAEQGKSIIMISSELPEILRMSHRIVGHERGTGHRRTRGRRGHARRASCTTRPCGRTRTPRRG